MRAYILRISPVLVFLIVSIILVACDDRLKTSVPTATSTQNVEQISTPSPLPPTSTPVPLAAVVEGEAITLEEFQAELVRFKAANPDLETADEAAMAEKVLDDLINQVLLAQAAREKGFELTDSELQDRLNKLVQNVNGKNAFQNWLAGNSYTEDTFKIALKRSLEAAWMRDQIIAEVPETAEQVHAYQILVSTADEANRILAQLDGGTSFATLAAAYDPITNGDLGWFPRGYLTNAKIEEAVFQLQPAEYTRVIETELGYHILQVVERDQNRPLSPEARLIWQEKALLDWITMHRDQAAIEVLLP